jgi:hypothetical protein
MEVLMGRALMLAVVVLLCACQTSYQGNEDSPYYNVPVGSTLILNNDITITPYKAGVYIQGGQTLPLSQVNKYYPHCKFEVLKIRDAPQTVKADTFVIEKVVQEITDTVDTGQLQLAGSSIGIGINISDSDGPSVQTYATRLNLRSERQPEVFRLSCGQWAYPSQGQQVTINEMRKALGNMFTLQLTLSRR